VEIRILQEDADLLHERVFPYVLDEDGLAALDGAADLGIAREIDLQTVDLGTVAGGENDAAAFGALDEQHRAALQTDRLRHARRDREHDAVEVERAVDRLEDLHDRAQLPPLAQNLVVLPALGPGARRERAEIEGHGVDERDAHEEDRIEDLEGGAKLRGHPDIQEADGDRGREDLLQIPAEG